MASLNCSKNIGDLLDRMTLGVVKSLGIYFIVSILDLQVDHGGGEAQKNILLVLLWASTNVGERHCQVCPNRSVASQE